jgi:RNA polymerase sigma-70 factor (ECF subfamily)
VPAASSTEAATLSQFHGWSDADIWNAFRQGKRVAFIYIYHLYFDAMFSYASQFSTDECLVEDCIQDLFIEMNATCARLGCTNNIKLYLYKAIKRKVLHAVRKAGGVMKTNDFAHAASFYFELSAEQNLINRQINEERLGRLSAAVGQLTARQREAIFYYYYEGFTMNEVRELLSIGSLKATQNLVYRAIKELRKHLGLIVFLTGLGQHIFCV